MQTFWRGCLALLVVALGASVAEAMPEKLAYRGYLMREGKAKAEMISIDYRIYDSAHKDRLLWSRTIPTKVSETGVFYVELEDGSSPTVTLADALAAAEGMPEIAIAEQNSAQELGPRQKLSSYVRATRVLRAQGVDAVAVSDRVAVYGTANVYELYAGSTSVQAGGSGHFPSACHLLPMNQRTIGGDQSKVVVKDVRIAEEAWPRAPSLYAPEKAASDAIATYENADGAFSLIVPQDGYLSKANGAANVRTIAVSAFGPLEK